MKLAIASKTDFDIMWKVYRALDMLQYCRTPLREKRLKSLIIGRMEQLGTGGFSRVVMGCQVLIDNCCDKEADTYEFSPKIQKALKLLAESENTRSEEYDV
tara:strand:+ start:8900 stop:9202 length:303 start_codon:yes stop_codon:yes gene_type:complete